MTFYYQHTEPMYYALFVFAKTTTIFGLVTARLEFWVFLFLHGILVGLTVSGTVETTEMEKFRWEAVSATQFFLTFFLTFYNSHCYTRYTELYNCCMQIMDSTLFFCHEIIVSLHPEELENHRTASIKYMIALVNVFFMSVESGTLTKGEWRELERKGLLTRVEAEQLEKFPARSHESVFVLASWSMQIVGEALRHDCLWTERSMRIAHCHNRADAHMTDALKACNQISSVLCLPIPFPYFNIMNAVLMFNAFILAVIMAFFKTYMTIFPYGVALLFFMGLREISAALADPFGTDDVDFPIHQFMAYVFDNSICLLETFRCSEATDVKPMLARARYGKPFTDHQLRRQTKGSLLYQKNYDPVTSNSFAWSREMPLQSMAGSTEGPKSILHNIVGNRDVNVKVEGIGGRGGKEEIEIDTDDEDSEMEDVELSLWERLILLVGSVARFILGKKPKPDTDTVGDTEGIKRKEAEKKEAERIEAEMKKAAPKNKDSLSDEELKVLKEAKEMKRLAKEVETQRSTNNAVVQHIEDMVRRIAIERDKIEMLGMTVPDPSDAFLHQIESGIVDENPLAFDPEAVVEAEDPGFPSARVRTKSGGTGGTGASSGYTPRDGYTPRGTNANPPPIFNDWDEARKLMMRAVSPRVPTKEATEEPMEI